MSTGAQSCLEIASVQLVSVRSGVPFSAISLVHEERMMALHTADDFCHLIHVKIPSVSGYLPVCWLNV